VANRAPQEYQRAVGNDDDDVDDNVDDNVDDDDDDEANARLMRPKRCRSAYNFIQARYSARGMSTAQIRLLWNQIRYNPRRLAEYNNLAERDSQLRDRKMQAFRNGQGREQRPITAQGRTSQLRPTSNLNSKGPVCL